ncbi:MAG: hypothetical protein V4710_23305 [Verrucomicrobiota bacterium]
MSTTTYGIVMGLVLFLLLDLVWRIFQRKDRKEQLENALLAALVEKTKAEAQLAQLRAAVRIQAARSGKSEVTP